MTKQMTISVEEDVYNSLVPLIAQHRLDDYIANLVRSRNADNTLEESYKDMAADTEREAEAMEWCNANFGRTSN